MKKGTFAYLCSGLALAAALGAGKARAGKLYQFTGKVAGLTDDTISLRSGDEVLEFSRDASRGPRDLPGIKVGDQITIWYSLDARKVKAGDGPAQQPGQAAPPSDPKDGSSGEKKGIILDDRAFYDARNESRPAGDASPEAPRG